MAQDAKRSYHRTTIYVTDLQCRCVDMGSEFRLIVLGDHQARSVPRVGWERAGVVVGLLVLLGG